MRLKVPFRRYFRYFFPLYRRDQKPAIDGDLRDWPPGYCLPQLGGVDLEPPFATVYAGWCPEGLGVALEVREKSRVQVDQGKFWTGDCLEIWLDTAPQPGPRTFDESCHHFYFLPRGGGRDGQAGLAGRYFPPGLDQRPQHNLSEVDVASSVTPGQYTLEAFLPASLLTGWDPLKGTELGFTYHVHDVQKGDQAFNLSKVFPIHADPNLWAAAKWSEEPPE